MAVKRPLPSYLPIYTVVKLIKNPDSSNQNKILSRNLGKNAFIHSLYTSRIDTSQVSLAWSQYWVVRVVDEIDAGRRSGCFLLEPIRQIAYEDCVPLSLGMYTEEAVDGCVVMRPYKPALWWLALKHKKMMAQHYGPSTYAIVVSIPEAAALGTGQN